MTAREISDALSGISVYSVQQVLARLLKSQVVTVTGITHTRNAIARQYRPVMTEASYLAAIANGESTGRLFTQNYVDTRASLEELQELETRIQARIRELEHKDS